MALGQLAITPRYANATSGDDWRLAFTLWDGGSVKNVSAATIRAGVQDLGGNLLVDATAQSISTTGASWSTGVVVIALTSASTSALQPGQYAIEIEVTLSGVITTFPLIPLIVQKSAMV